MRGPRTIEQHKRSWWTSVVWTIARRFYRRDVFIWLRKLSERCRTLLNIHFFRHQYGILGRNVWKIKELKSIQILYLEISWLSCFHMLSLRRQAARKRRPGRRIPGEHCWFDGRWADGGGFNTFCPCIGRVGASCNTLLSQGFEWAVCCDDSFGPEGNKDCPLLNLTYYQPHAFCSHHLHALSIFSWNDAEVGMESTTIPRAAQTVWNKSISTFICYCAIISWYDIVLEALDVLGY